MDTMPIFTRVDENLISLRNSMVTKVLGWLRKRPKVWLSVCYVSCVVGLLFLALSSSFICLIEKWIWWKILLYTIVSLLIILVVVWLTKPSDSSISREREAGTQSISRTTSIVSVLVVTLVYTHFVEEKVDVKPDAYIFVSYAAFSIMSLFLSTLSHYGFEVELFYFFTGILTLQFMKIKWWLVIVGLVIMFILDYLRSTLDTPPTSESRVLKDPNHVPNSQVTSSLNGCQENEDKIGLLTAGASSSQGAPANEELFSACIKALQKENDKVADHVFQSIIKDNANLVDTNLVVKSLSLEDLHKSVQLMMKEGLKQKCLEEYTSWRRKFLDIILSLFPSPDLKMEDIENGEKIEDWVRTLTIAVRILFPNETTLCERVFGSHYFPYSALADVFKESAIRLIVSSYALSTWSRCKPDTLPQLLQELETTFWHLPGESSSLIIDQLNQVRFMQNNFGYFKNTLSNDTATDGIHPLTRQVMKYIGDEFKKKDDSDLGRCFEEYATAAKEGNLLSSPPVEGTIKLLESNLEATSKSYKTPSLGYVFIMINRSFIASEMKRLGLEHIIGHDWVQRNQQKIEQNLQLYLDSSWSQILNLLNDEDFHEAESDYLRDLMEENLNSFHQHFDGICNDKSMWFVFDDKLRDQIIKSIKNMLLPAYKNFVDRFYESLPYTSYRVIKPEPRVVEDRLNNLFLERADESDAGREPKKDV